MIKNHIGSWSNPQCTVNNCLKSPIKILRVKAGWDIPSGEPHPYQGREQWSDFDYLPCNDHVTMVIDYLVGREFPRESIIELGGAEEIRKRQLKDIEDERNTE